MVQEKHKYKNNIIKDKIQSHKINKWFKEKGWSFYDYQIKALKAINQNKDILITSPTGSGKTLAGLLPTILESDKFKKNNLYTIFISPLKSLSYDIERNLLIPINECDLNLTISVRTGDTTTYTKTKQIEKPPNILVTTPESFALLMSYKNAEEYFSNLKYLIIDELHNIIHSKRGDLLALNIARLNEIAPNHNKIALSATLKDIKTGLAYFSNKKKSEVIKSLKYKKLSVSIIKTTKNIPWSGYMATYAIKNIYNNILKHKSSIIFVNTRAQAEVLFRSLWKINKDKLNIAVHHGSLEKKLRIKIEEKMFRGLLNCIVATSSLELGIDWGNISLIIQVGAPKGISRMIQRIGRSNHKINLPSKAILVPTNKFEYLECEAAKKAIYENDIEEIKIKKGSLDVLAQHIFGVACSKPFNAGLLFKNIKTSFPYKNLDIITFNKVLEFVKNGGYSLKHYKEFNKIKKNIKGNYEVLDKKLIHKYRMNIGTIVESDLINVYLKNKKLGKIEEYFVQNLVRGDTFLFAGEVLEYLENNVKGISVKKSKNKYPKIPSYVGGRLPLSTKLSRHVIELINNYKNFNMPPHIEEWLQKQEEYSMLPPSKGLLIETFTRNNFGFRKNYLVAYTFQGRSANQTLGLVVLNKMLKLNLKPIAFTATDYALVVWSEIKCNDVEKLFENRNFFQGFNQWLENTSLIRKHFKDVAVISGLIDKNYPGYIKTHKQIKFNSDLIYEVLKKYERNHILLKSTKLEAMDDLLDYNKIKNYLLAIKNNIIHKNLKRVSPMSIPLLLEFNIEKVKEDNLIDIIEEENNLLLEANLH